MKNALYLTSLLLCIPFVGLLEGDLQKSAGIPTEGIFAASTEFNDLDARDAQNHPISTPEAHRQLAQLFIENLFQMTVVAPSHAALQAAQSIEAFSALFLKAFFASAQGLLAACHAALAPDKKRFVHNVHNLWITLSVGVFLAAALSSLFALPRSPKLIPLRC